ncbi:MAG: insulinase family protein [Zunongwangia sp.]|uniref:M16 family metallopeptidase n=1 Tax=Zunongwangia sp. TaxID=1965325 RepID=UPI0032421202
MKDIKQLGKSIRAYLIILCLGIGLKTFSQNQVEDTLKSIPLDPSVRYGKLDNGFTYYLKENHNPEKKIFFNLVVKAGYSNEETDQLQYAHLLEHLVAKQTRSFPDVRGYFKKIGGFSNAQTRSNATIYTATAPANTKNIMEEGSHILFEWAQGGTWSQESIAIEREAVQGEMRTKDPHGLWQRRMRSKQLAEPLGLRVYNETAHIKSLKNYKHDALLNYYNKWYRPDLQAAIIVGNFNVDSLEIRIKKLFSQLGNPTNDNTYHKRIKFKNSEESNKYSVVNDSIDTRLRLEIIRKRPNLDNHMTSLSDYRHMLIEKLYNKILSEREKFLSQDYISPFSSFDPDYNISGEFGHYFNTAYMRIEVANTQDLKQRIQKGISAWKKLHHNINSEDLNAAKELIIKESYTKKSLGSKLIVQKLQDHFINHKAAPNRKNEIAVTSKMLKEISLKDLNRFIEENTSLSRNTHLIFYKEKNKAVPGLDTLTNWIQKIEKATTDPLKTNRKSIANLEQKINIVDHTPLKKVSIQKNEIGVSTIKLPNNITLIFKPGFPRSKQFENIISIDAFRPIPASVNNKKEYMLGQLAPDFLQYTGAGNYNKFILQQFMQEHNMSLNFSSDIKFQKISGQSERKDFLKLIELLNLYLEKPRKDEEAFMAWKNKLNDRLDGKEIRGSTAFIMQKINPVWYPELPTLQKEDLAQLSMQDTFKAIYKSFSSIEGFTFIITGDFETDEIATVLSNRLMHFPIKNEIIPEIKLQFPLKKIKKDLTYKNIDHAYVRLFFPVEVEKNIKTKVELQLLANALNERIFERLREGSYAPVARGRWIDLNCKIYLFEIEFDSAIGNEEHLIQLAYEEFLNLKENGVTQDWLDTAIKNQLQYYENSFKRYGYSNFWTTYLQEKFISKENISEEVLQYGTILEHFISLDDINLTAKKYMSMSYSQKFLGFPEQDI